MFQYNCSKCFVYSSWSSDFWIYGAYSHCCYHMGWLQGHSVNPRPLARQKAAKRRGIIINETGAILDAAVTAPITVASKIFGDDAGDFLHDEMDRTSLSDSYTLAPLDARLVGERCTNKLADLTNHVILDIFARKAELDGDPPGNFNALMESLLGPDSAHAIDSAMKSLYCCDHCNSCLIGERYTCTTCDQFDLCTDCYARNLSTHNPAHEYDLLALSREQFREGLETLQSIGKELMHDLQSAQLQEIVARVDQLIAQMLCNECYSPLDSVYLSCKYCDRTDICWRCVSENSQLCDDHRGHPFSIKSTENTNSDTFNTRNCQSLPSQVNKASHFACDVCQQFIMEPGWLRCNESPCLGRVDLHVQCAMRPTPDFQHLPTHTIYIVTH